jgi:isoquinoline 1-oxidoreductase beta subunit
VSNPVGRRFFLSASLTAGAVFVVGCTPEQVPPPHVAPPPSTTAKADTPPAAAPTFSSGPWIRIAPDGVVTVVVDKSEMGQGVETSIPMLVAEELDADWAKIQIEFAPVAPEYKNRMFGSQGTGGSTTIRGSYMPLRAAGAAAREMLVAAAAATWGVEAASCRTEKGEVVHPPSNRRIGYGGLTAKAATMPVPAEPKLKSPGDFHLIGTRAVRLDGPGKATGKVEFGIDVHRPGMLTATVVRSPVIGGKPAKFDAAAAGAVKGVKKVLQISGGIAVVGEHFWAAKKGADALAITWDDGPNAALSSEKLTEAAALLAKKPGVVAQTRGDFEKGLKSAFKKIDSVVYEAPHQAHATMEPQTCTAEVRKDGCDIWVGTQFQEATQKVAAKITGLPVSSIAVHTTYLGGGFGRRSEMDFIIDALEIAKEMPGTPVKVIWTREEDLRHDFYRPASYNVLRGGVSKDGKPVAWSHRIVSPSIMTRVFPQFVKNGIDNSSVEGAIDLPYGTPNVLVDYHMHETGVPVGFWRSVGHSQNAFISESFFDELCALTKQDPFETRRALMTGAPRLKAAMELAAAKAGWGKPLEKGKGRGIAVQESFGSFVAQVAEVTVSDDGKVKVDRIVCAIDCGAVVNPDTVEAQVQGAVAFGLTATLKSEITLTGGKVNQSNFHNFKLLKIDEMPVVEVYIVPSTEKSGGCGEPGTPPVAPAVANAIFAATGKRIRKLPIKPADLKK